MSYEKDSKKFWVEIRDNNPIFLFKDPTSDGKCTVVRMFPSDFPISFKLYYNTCRKINEVEYVTYKLLGYLDE